MTLALKTETQEITQTLPALPRVYDSATSDNSYIDITNFEAPLNAVGSLAYLPVPEGWRSD